jgi:hypothetical protein
MMDCVPLAMPVLFGTQVLHMKFAKTFQTFIFKRNLSFTQLVVAVVRFRGMLWHSQRHPIDEARET